MIGGFIGKAIGEPPRAGGTLFLKTLSVTCTTTVNAARLVGKVLAVACASTVTKGPRAITKALTVSCHSTVARAKAVMRTFALTCSSATAGVRQAQKVFTTSPVVSTVTQGAKSISKVLAVACHTSTSSLWAGIRRSISISTHIKWH